MSENYPCGADDEFNAPWNNKYPDEHEIEVTVSLTLSKTVTVRVTDYTITDQGIDEDGEYFENVDYSTCNLKKAVEDQIVLPHKADGYILPECDEDIKVISDLSCWNVDEFEVIKE